MGDHVNISAYADGVTLRMAMEHNEAREFVDTFERADGPVGNGWTPDVADMAYVQGNLLAIDLPGNYVSHPFDYTPRVIQLAITTHAGDSVGVAHWLDSSNFARAIIDFNDDVRFIYRVAGAGFDFGPWPITFVADAQLELHYDPFTGDYDVIYDGVVLHTETVADPVFVTMEGAAIYSTDDDNRFSHFRMSADAE